MQLLDEMIDNGFPLTTEPNILREMIAPPNLVSKVLSVVTGNTSNMSNTLPGSTGSCVPWRKTDLKHSSNEVYVDLVEEMDATINRFISYYHLTSIRAPYFSVCDNLSNNILIISLIISSKSYIYHQTFSLTWRNPLHHKR